MKKVFSIIIIVITTTNILAQHPVVKAFTTNDGLSTNQVHDIIEDENGLLWLATDKGVVTFDGENFKTYTVNDGLLDNSILSLYRCNSGRIYFASFNGGLCYYYRDSFYKHVLNPEIKELTRNQFIVSLAEDNDTNVYFTVNGIDTIFKITPTNKLIKYHPNSLNPKQKLEQLYFLSKINNMWVFSNNTSKSSTPIKKIANIYISPSKQTIHFDGYKDIIIIKKGIIKTSKNNYIFTYKRFNDVKPKGYITLIRKDNTDSTFVFNNEIQCTYNDTINNYFFIGFKNNGIYRYNSIEDIGTNNYIHILPNTTISSIHKDRYNSYWLTSNTDGLYKIPSFSFINYSNIIKPNYKVTDNKKNIYWFDQDGALNTIDSLNKQLILTKKHPNASFLYYTHDMLFIKRGANLQITNSKNKQESTYKYNGGISCMNYISPTKFVIGGLLGFEIVENNQTIYSSELNRHLFERITAINTINDTELLVGTVSGLYHYKDQHVTPVKNINKLKPNRIACIKKFSDSTFIIANNGNFLSIFNIKTQQVTNLSQYSEKLIISDICINNDNSFWVASNNGIVLFTISKMGINTLLFDKRDGLLSDNVLSIHKIIDKLWVTTDYGTMYINLAEIAKINTRPSIYVKNITLGDNNLKYDYSLFDWKDYTLNVSYASVSPSSENSIKYAYFLGGFDSDTNYTTDNNLRYTKLLSGKYKLYIWAIDKNGIWSKNNITREFTINKHYTETWWFISLMVLAGILAISSIFLLIIRNLNKRSALQRNLLITEQKALRAQMNPHFTFNALNSIQYFLTDNDKLSATTFLSKFSMLVRKVLYNSNNNFITLEEEITTLKLYLDLEELRFGDKLKVNINIGEDVYMDEIMVPSMIIQPFLENAIWHGIMPKESGKGNLTLNFKMDEKKLVCIIRDDGIGREKSVELKAIQRKGHKSTGLKNIEDRISVLNHINPNNKILLKISDITSETSQVIGTEVKIIFEQKIN